jgi:hypothetical protein
VSYLDDLTADEVEVLGHSLRMVPGNACLTGKSAQRLGGGGLQMIYELDAFKSLWNKVAEAILERDDMQDRRVPRDA